MNGHAYGVVYLNGREHYLGAYGSPESILRYNELVGRWLAAGRTLPEEQAATALSVNEVLLRYVEHCQRRYAARRQVASILSRTKVALRAVRELYGTTSAAAFGPKALGVVRQSWITSGRARRTINEFVATAKACFKWAASEELVPGPVWHALSAVGGLRRGDANVPEPKKVKPVPDAYVDAVLPYLPKVVRAMVEVQRLTGMRSGEVCIMRTRDIDMTGKLWVYRPQYHKSDLHGHEREVYIGERGQEVLRSWLRTELDGYLFQPREAMVAIRAERHARRVTPLRYGNVPGKKRRGTKRLPRDHYDTGSYRCAIAHACDKADAAERAKLPPGEHGDERLIPQWTPHQLRHTYATRVRREYGIEAARVMLGHQHVGVTEIYAERDHAVAATVAAKIG
jgi:integrase